MGLGQTFALFLSIWSTSSTVPHLLLWAGICDGAALYGISDLVSAIGLPPDEEKRGCSSVWLGYVLVVLTLRTVALDYNS